MNPSRSLPLSLAFALFAALPIAATPEDDKNLAESDRVSELERKVDLLTDELARTRQEMGVPEEKTELESVHGLGPGASVSAGPPVPRVKARAAPYEAGSAGRRAIGWDAPDVSANLATASAATIRARCRDAVRNDAWARAMVETLVDILSGFTVNGAGVAAYPPQFGLQGAGEVNGCWLIRFVGRWG